MRASLLLLALLPAAPLAAQFEGTISLRMTAPEMGNDAIDAKYHVKGDRVAMVMTAPASAGPMAGSEMRMLFNPAAKKMTMLIPMPGEMGAAMGGAKGIKMETDLNDLPVADAPAAEGTVKALGTSQRIAGRSCDDYEVQSEGETFQMCLADGLGNFMMAAGGGMGRSASVPKWAQNLAGKFPLKISDTRGRGVMEVTAIEAGTVPAAMFDVPSDYRDMGAMMGGMRRNN